MRGETARTLVWATAVSAIAGVLYLLTAARDIVVGDSPELIIAAATLGVAHPPGYPLFTMLGHLFSLLPFGTIPFRINLVSVVCQALTAGVVFLTAFRVSGARLAAATAALVLASNPLFWSWSLVAETFPLNNVLASVLILLFVTWYEQPERTGLLIAAFFTIGLALTNHQTIVLLAPAFGFLLWKQRALLRERPQILALGALVFLLGLLPYAYVLWAAARQPAYSWGGVSSLGDLFALIMRKSYGAGQLVHATYRGGSALHRILALFLAFGALMGLLTIAGLAKSYRKLAWYFWFSLLGLIFTGPFFVTITNLNLAGAPSALFVLERFFLLPQVIAAPLLALGIIRIAELIDAYAPEFPVRSLALVAGAAGVVLAVGLITTYHRVNQSRNHIARTYAEDVFGSLAPNTILLVTGDGLSLPLLYLNIVERVRPDMTLIIPPILAAEWYVRQLRQRDPHLGVPFNYYDGSRNNMKTLVNANARRPIAVIGPLPDSSLDQDYFPYLHGLVNMIEPKSKTITLDEMVKDNQQLLKQYRPPSAASVNTKSFESEILSLYTQPAWRIGNEYERVGAKSEARNWYKRALAINPNFFPARQALAQDTEP